MARLVACRIRELLGLELCVWGLGGVEASGLVITEVDSRRFRASVSSSSSLPSASLALSDYASSTSAPVATDSPTTNDIDELVMIWW